MKIVQINAVYGASSTGRTVKEMHEYLIAQGEESYVFTAMGEEKEYLIGNTLDHKWHALMSRLSGRPGYYSKRATLSLVKKLEVINPDAVILRNLHANYIHLRTLLEYLSERDILTIIVLHDCWFFTGHCCHYTEINCNKWQTHCKKCPLHKIDHESWFFDMSSSIFKDRMNLMSKMKKLLIIGVSDWIAGEAKKSPIFNNALSIQRIYNWIDLNKFYPRNPMLIRSRIGLKKNNFVALGVSMRWDYKKGLEVFLAIAKEMSDIVIILIGEKPKMDMPENVLFRPATSSIEELAEYYSTADVLLNFSIQETFGKVAAESLSCGTPIIVNNATANPEIVGDCGFIIENNRIDQIKESIARIRYLGKASFKQKCIDRARLLFEKDANLNQYRTIINKYK